MTVETSFADDQAVTRRRFGDTLSRVVYRIAPHARVESLPDTGGWEIQTAGGSTVAQVFLRQTDWTTTPEVYVPVWRDDRWEWQQPYRLWAYYHHIHEPAEEVWAVIGGLVQRAET